MLKKFAFACFFLTLIGQPLATANTYEVKFGRGMGRGRDQNPTIVKSGTGTLADELVGQELYWVCLDLTTDWPSNSMTFNIGQDSSILKNGLWSDTPLGGRISLQTNADVILSAIANIYYNHENAILSDFSGADQGAGAAFQIAVWALTMSYSYGDWSGALTEEILSAIGSSNHINDDYRPLAETYLLSALDGDAAQGRKVYLGNIVLSQSGDEEIQSVMMFTVIPEPSSVALMIGAAGIIGFLSRRRVKLQKS